MSVSGISASNLVATYAPPPPQLQQAPVPKKAANTDTVSLSKQAQQLASDGDPAALEAQESSAEKASETYKGKA
ncbi:MAG: hypothetical protein PHH28_14400 [Desulfuromonadaceae bacterium]|nr:hypothetical protein [Desulfuromonadaceae bacterium]